MIQHPKRLSIAILVFISLISLFFAWQLPQIEFDHDLEAFFPAQEPETAHFFQFREVFGNDNDYLLIGIRNEAGIFDSTFLAQVDTLSQELAKLSTIEFLISPTQIKNLKRNALGSGLRGGPFLHIKQPLQYARDSATIYAHPLLPDFLFSTDRQSLCLYLQNTPRMEAASCEQLSDSITALVERFSFDEVHMAGKCFGQTQYIHLIEREIVLFTAVAIAMIMLFLWLTYRRLWGIWLPLLVVGLTVLWTLGIMVLIGKPIDIISHIIPTILLVIGIANLVHLLTHFGVMKQQEPNTLSALKVSIREVGLATVLTTTTTAIGFLTLSTSSFISLADLGIYATIGLLIALLLSYTLAPAIILLLPELKASPSATLFRWQQPLLKAFDWVSRNRKACIGFSLLLFLLAGWSASQLRINRYVLDDFKPSHPQRQHFTFFATQFGGARSFEMHLSLRDSSADFTQPEVLREIESVETYLREQYGIGNLVSPATLIKQANQVYHFGQERHYRLPDRAQSIEELLTLMDQQAQQLLPGRLISTDRKQGRITGKMADLGSHVIEQRNAALASWLETHTDYLTYRTTGTLHLIDLNNELMAINVLIGLAGAIVLVGLLFALLMRSWIIVGITLLINLLPLVSVAGFMSLAGIDLKISTAIVFIISFGIAVDDSIHFLSRFRREVRNYPVPEALRRTYLSTGKAIVLTSLILCSGFLTLCLSDFLSTFYIGLLISLTLLFALLADMVLLPALLLQFYKSPKP